MDNSNPTTLVKIALMGCSGVGKTSFCSVVQTGEFPVDTAPTLSPNQSKKTITVNGEQVRVMMIDTEGEEDFRLMTSSYFRGVDVVCLMYEIDCKHSWSELVATWYQNATAYQSFSGSRFECCLVGNKSDLPRQVDANEVQQFADDIGMDSFIVSAKNNENIEETIKTLTQRALNAKSTTKVYFTNTISVKQMNSTPVGLGTNNDSHSTKRKLRRSTSGKIERRFQNWNNCSIM